MIKKEKANPNCPKCKGKGEYYFCLPDAVSSPNLVRCDCIQEKDSEEAFRDMYRALKGCLNAIGIFQKALKYTSDCKAYSDAKEALLKAKDVMRIWVDDPRLHFQEECDIIEESE